MNIILSKRSINWKKTIFISLKQKSNNSLNNGQKKQKAVSSVIHKKRHEEMAYRKTRTQDSRGP